MSWDYDAISVLPEEWQNDVIEYLSEKLSDYIVVLQEKKPAVDEQKKRMAEVICEHDLHYHPHSKRFLCAYSCKGQSVSETMDFKHDYDCIVTEAQEYLKGLEGEL